MPARIFLAFVCVAILASVTDAAAQFSAYAEPGFGYTPERRAIRSRPAHLYYRWVDPVTGQPYNLSSPAYGGREPDRRAGERW
jgi:hypothetical protein